MLMAQRPGQLKRLFESLGGTMGSLDIDAALADLDAHLGAGGSLAQYGAKRQLDPTTLYLLAVQSRIALRAVKPKLAHRLERESDALLAEYEAEVSAALNTSQALRALAGSASDRMWMRSLYVDAIKVRTPINESFEALLLRFGTRGFEGGARTLLRALSEDIAAHRSSVAPDRLQALLLSSLVAMRHVLGLIHTAQDFLHSQGLRKAALLGAGAGANVGSVDGLDAASRQQDRQPWDAGRETDGESGKDTGRGQGEDRGEVVTIQLIRLLLQMTVNAGASKGVPVFLDKELGFARSSENRPARLRADFISLIRGLPASMWKEAAHKDHLLETLRRQFDVELAQRTLGPAATA